MEISSKTWEALYHEHFDLIYRWIARLVGPGEDIEDLTQEVFLIVRRKYPGFKGESSVTTWLRRIATKVTLQHLRKRRRRRLLREVFSGGPELSPLTPTPLELLQSKESRELVYRVLERLPAKKRIVLSLYEIEGLSGAEVAQFMDCSIEMVWKHLHNSRKAFLQEVRRMTVRDRLAT